MKCVICKQGHTEPGFTSVTLEKTSMLLIVKKVPAQVCTNCGESYIDDTVSQAILKIANVAFRSGVQLEVCSFQAA